MQCPICSNKSVVKIFEHYPGYIENSFYDIFLCNKCNTHFIDSNRLDKNIYELIYANDDIKGYDKYFGYAEKVKKEKNPLKYLAYENYVYFPLYKYIKNKKKLKILDIGCGVGYVSYSLKTLGHDVLGIDISEKAIDMAKNSFGSYFRNESFEDFILNEKNKYDLIIATELIEHLAEPLSFLEKCLNILQSDGEILLTTPNKDFSSTKCVWYTDLPPVHLTWLSKNSFRNMSKTLNTNLRFIEFVDYFPASQNRLIKYYRFQENVIQEHSIDINGNKYIKKTKVSKNILRSLLKKIVHTFPLVVYPSNYFLKFFTHEEESLAIILSKK